MQDVEISTTHLKFTTLNQSQILIIKNNRTTHLNIAFRLYNLQNYSITPNTLSIKPNESATVTIKLKNYEAKEDFIYLKGDKLDFRIAVSIQCDSSRIVDQYIFEDVGNRQQSQPQSSPGFQYNDEQNDLQHLDTFGNQRSEAFLIEENKILQQRINYLSQQNQILNDALEQFLNQSYDGQNIQNMINTMMEQERQENEFRSQRVLLMIEEKDKEIKFLKQEIYQSTQKQVREWQHKNEQLHMQIQELQAQSSFQVHKPEQESYIALYRKYESLNDRYKKMENLKNSLNEELLIMAQRLDESGNLTQSRISDVQTSDKLINRLNAKITQLKLREEKLLEENARLEDMLQGQEWKPIAQKNPKDDLLNREFQILERSKRDLEIAYKELQLEKQHLEMRCDDAIKENGLISDELWKATREIEKQKMDIRKLKEQDFSKERMEYESQIFALEQTLKQCNNLKEAKQQARQRWEEELSNLNKNHQIELNNYDNELRNLQNLINKYKDENTLLLQQQKELSYTKDKELQQQIILKEQMQDLELRNQKLNKINNQNQIDIEKTKTEFILLRDKTDDELQRRDNIEKSLNDKIICLQDQINNIMKEKQTTKSDLQNEINKLCLQHKNTINQILQDNKHLEQQCIALQEEIGRQKQQFCLREEQLIKEVRNMQDRIESLLNNSKLKQDKKKQQDTLKQITTNQEIERKQVDMYMQKIRGLEDELNQTRTQKLQLEYDLQHQQQKQVQLSQNANQQQYDVSNDLDEIKSTLYELRMEREKIISQLYEKDQEIRNFQDQIDEYHQLVEAQQRNQEKMEQQIIRLNDELKKTIEQKNMEINKFRIELDLKQEQNLVYQEQTKLLQQDRRDINEKCYVQNFEIETLKQNHLEIENQRKLQISELKTKLEIIIKDHQENTEIISKINEAMVNQKLVYEETIQRQKNIIELVKEKFIADIQELFARQNQYFNQNENIKKSLNPQKETQLMQLIQQYSENVMNLAQNQQKIKTGTDKSKQLQQTINNLKTQNKELNDKITNLQAENQELTKKVDKFKPKIPGVKKRPQPQQLQQEQLNNPQEYFNLTILLQEGRLAECDAQCNHYKAQLQMNESIIEQLTNVNVGYEAEIKKLQQSYGQVQEALKIKDQQIADQQKQFKQENQKFINELNQVQNKFVPEDKVQSLYEVIAQKDSKILELKDELLRRKDVADQFRTEREERQQQLEKLKKQSEDLVQENEKLKLKQKERDRQDINYKEFKEKYEQMKQQEKQNLEEMKALTDKNKQLRNEVQRKEQNLREMKDKFDQIQNIRPNDNEKQELVVQIKKQKEELNRKDQTIKHYKQKFEDKCTELENQKNDFTLKYSQTVQELEKEMRKYESQKIGQKKQENLVNQLTFLIKKLYRENFMELQKSRPQPVKGGAKNINKFTESMNILNLGPEELDEFLEPNISVTTVKKNSNKDIERFEQEFMNLDQIDVNSIYSMLNNLIADRVNNG